MIPLDELVLRRRVAEEAAKAAGAVHLRFMGEVLERDLHDGNRADYTTLADLEAQEAVKQTVARYYPGELVIGEEDLDLRKRIGDHVDTGCWLTDPLDGTQEFSHGNPACSCVVGFVREGRPLAAAAYFATWDELFSAALGLGATLNGAPMHVSGVTQLERALFATPQPPATEDRAGRFREGMTRLLPHVEGFRMPGAQSYMVCGVAAGRYDITSVLSPRLEPNPDRPYLGQPWETAALVLLVQEAGGAVERLGGGPSDLLGYNVYGASPQLLEQYFAVTAG